MSNALSHVFVIGSGKGQNYHCAPNEQMRFMISAAETVAQSDFVECVVGYLGGPPLHIHPEQEEIHYVLQGRLSYQIGEARMELKSGDCIYIPKGTPHSWINLKQEPARILGILTPGGSEGFFKALVPSITGQLNAEAQVSLAQEYGTEIVGPPLAATLKTNPNLLIN